MRSPVDPDPGAVLRVAVRVRPGASRPAVGGVYAGPLGPALVVAVNAPAVGGRATEATLRAVADALGVRRRDVRLVHGAAGRDKLVEVAPSSPGVERRLTELRGTP